MCWDSCGFALKSDKMGANMASYGDFDPTLRIVLEMDTSDFSTDHDFLDEEDEECEGHESLNGADMGVTVYCDGSCR